MAATRVTVTLPGELLAEIDQQTDNRSLFVAEAVRAELHRRRKERLIESLQQAHPESLEMADCGFDEWVFLTQEGDCDLVDPSSLRPIRWEPGKGWQDRA